MSDILCPACDGQVDLPNDALLGELLICPDCDVELELTALAPLTVALAPEVEEDWGE